jgi:hypothetical protein
MILLLLIFRMVFAPLRIQRFKFKDIRLRQKLTDTKRLRNKGNLAFGINFNTHLAKFYDRAGLLALLHTFLWPTPFSANDGDTAQRLISLLIALSYSLLGRHYAILGQRTSKQHTQEVTVDSEEVVNRKMKRDDGTCQAP